MDRPGSLLGYLLRMREVEVAELLRYVRKPTLCSQLFKKEDTMDKTRMLPVCPDCGEEMVKARHENEEGDWSYYWLCACKVEEVPE